MAKVSDIKFEIKGVDYKINVNCTSSGQFNTNIPKEVADSLRIEEKITANTLADLNKIFFEKLDHYKTLETTETLHIFIKYQARGNYVYNSLGNVMFGAYEKKYTINTSFSEFNNALGFDFFVAIKQTIDGKDKWFKATLGKDCSWIQTKEFSQPDIYHKMSIIHDIGKYKIIPFNETALNTLKIAEEKLRQASEVLYNFIEKSEDQILLTLTNQKLLS